eukprot:TRINITY_DN1615_c0_g1_i9.p1 TRINITY_DN1615_c0_g1~~TRINITY_DN1615_c0_g1_i9.p1  ORF type:complete len:1199 (+),score=258.84 TRINITY_DN1615_c0_g1_i9:248-3598(+)
MAQFHAGMGIREVVVQKFALMSLEERINIRSYILNFIIAENRTRFVQTQLLQTVATIWKLGWQTEPEGNKQSLWNDIGTLLSADVDFKTEDHGDNMAFYRVQVAIGILLAFVSEFAADKASSVQKTMDFHIQIQKAFQQSDLCTVFGLALVGLKSIWDQCIEPVKMQLEGVANGSVNASVDDLMSLLSNSARELLGTILSLTADIFSWDFDCKPGEEIMRPSNNISFSAPLLKPGVGWNMLVQDGSVTEMFIEFHRLLTSTGVRDRIIPHHLRNILVQLASISGKIFTTEEQKVAHVNRLCQWGSNALSGGLCLAKGVIGVTSQTLTELEGQEEYSLSQFLLRLITNYGLGCVGTLESFPQIMEGLLKLTLKLLHISSSSCSAQDSDASQLTAVGLAKESLDYLLEVWVCLVGKDLDRNSDMGQAIIRAAGEVFSAVVSNRIQSACNAVLMGSQDYNPFEDPSILEEHLLAVAFIGRSSPSQTVVSLNEHLSVMTHRLSQEPPCITGGTTMESLEIFEEIYWLMLFVGRLLADQPDGETPLIPDSISALSIACPEASMDPVIILSNSLLNVVRLHLNHLMMCIQGDNTHKFLSCLTPLPFKAVLSTAHWWSCTYLCPDTSLYSNEGVTLPSNIISSFSSEGSSREIVSLFIRFAITSIGLWCQEEVVVSEALKLLSRITDSHIRPVLQSTDEWWNCLDLCGSALLGGVTNGPLALGISSLPLNAAGQLLETLCVGCTGSAQMVEALQKLSSPFDRLQHAASNIIDENELLRIISYFRGFVRSCSSASKDIITSLTMNMLPSLCEILRQYHDKANVVSAILKSIRDVAESQAHFLSSQEMNQLGQSVLQISQTLSVCRGIPEQNQEAKNEEQEAKDLKRIFMVVSHVLGKSFFDFSDDDEAGLNVGPCVSQCLCFLLPLIQDDHLHYPKLTNILYQVMSTMADTFPAELADMNQTSFGVYLRLLGSGLQSGTLQINVEGCRHCLDATAALGEHHWQEVQSGKVGMSAALEALPDLFGLLMQCLLNLLCSSSFSSKLTTCFSSAFFAMVVVAPDVFNQQLTVLLDGMPSNSKDKLQSAFHELLTNGGLTLDLSRVNRRLFRDNFSSFFNNARNLLKLK